MEKSQDDPFIEEEGMSSKGYYQDEGEEGICQINNNLDLYLIELFVSFTYRFKFTNYFT